MAFMFIATRSTRRGTGVSGPLSGIGLVIGLSTALTLAGCTSSSPTPSSPKSTSGGTTVSAGVTKLAGTDAGTTEGASGGALPPIAGAVAVDYDLSPEGPRPAKEVPVPITTPTKQLVMDISKITYGGVVCGFNFTGEQPASPMSITMTVVTAEGVLKTAKIPFTWTGDTAEVTPSAVDGWQFDADARRNRAGIWVLQVASIPNGGGKSVKSPKQARCVLDTPVALTTEAGPVNMWAGFATQ